MNDDATGRIEKSFAALAPKADELVERFYERLFSEHPGVRAMFPDEMAPQRKKLVGAIALAVENLRKPETLAPVLKEMGARHVGYGTLPEHYPIVRDTLLAAMGELAGSLWTAQLEGDWRDALNYVAEQMLEGAAEAQKKAA